MPEPELSKLSIAALITAGGAVLANIKMLAGIMPRLSRAEKDIDKKVNVEKCDGVKNHLSTKFKDIDRRFDEQKETSDLQGKAINKIGLGVEALLDRERGTRKDDSE